MATDEGTDRGIGRRNDSVEFLYELEWPSAPEVTVRRSILVLLPLTAVLVLMAVYGDAVVPGVIGNWIALLGLLGTIFVVPTLLSELLGGGSAESVFDPRRKRPRP